MILTLLSMLGGGAMRLLPEVFGLLNKKADNSHELAMLDKQLQLEQLKAASEKAIAEVQAQATITAEEQKAQEDALQQQFQLLGEHFQTIGNKWIDGFDALVRTLVDVLNMLVRPLTTYYFLLMFGAYKAALLNSALAAGANVWQSILQVYTPNDQDMLAGILAFWFVGRVFDKQK